MRRRWLIWVLLVVFMLADAVVLLFAPLTPISPNQLMLPTAEYLLQNPAPKPGFLSLNQQSSQCALTLYIDEWTLVNVEQEQSITKNFVLLIDGIEVQS